MGKGNKATYHSFVSTGKLGTKPIFTTKCIKKPTSLTEKVPGRVQKCSESMQGCDEEGQGSPGIEAGKGCQKQQEGLLQLHQQQKEG